MVPSNGSDPSTFTEAWRRQARLARPIPQASLSTSQQMAPKEFYS